MSAVSVTILKRVSISHCPPGPSQSAPGQYPNYPQGQGQQYGAYRPPQPGPPQGQQQRPYAYEQVSMPTAVAPRQTWSVRRP